jgi:beta-glucanase (GH16 family)
MPRGSGTSSRRTAPALALTLVLFVAAADAPAASGNAPRPASPRGGEARDAGTPKRSDRPAGPTRRPDDSVRPNASGPGAPEGKRRGWVLTFSDDFDGRALDKTKWSNGFGWGQATNSDFGWCDPRNNVVSGGVLTQRIERRPGGGQPFRVGCIHSKDKFAQRYGYWEARIRAAGCFGSRTAFWGKPNDESWPPEIDVVEVNGQGPRTDTAKFTVHWRRGDRHLQDGDYHTGPNFSEDYHVFGAEWSPEGVIFSVDGVERWRTPAGARFLDKAGPFYTIVNSQVIERDSTCGDIPSRAASYVDYVRVWSPAEPGDRPPVGDGRGRPSDRSGECGVPTKVRAASPLPPGHGEASGAVASKRFPGLGWFIRDSGNPASLYAFRVDGSGSRQIREVAVTGATNRDWEDLTYYVGPDGRGRLLIIESGQSGGDRFIYEVVEPDPDAHRTAPARRYQYAYPDLDARQGNTESAFMVGDRLALVTKTSPGRIYRFDDLTGGVNRPKFMGHLVDADRVSVVRLSPDRRTLVAASHTRAIVYEGLPPATPIRGVVGRKPTRITGVDRGANIEAGDWFPHDSCQLLLLAENRSAYQLRLSNPGSTTASGHAGDGDRRPRRGPARAVLD